MGKKHRPHVCFIAPNAFPLLAGDADIQLIGGAELQQVIIARGLARRGYRVSMICLDFGQEDKFEIDGIVVYRAFRPSEGIPVLRFVWPRLSTIWGCLKRANADIYYHRAASVLTGVMAAFCQRHNRKSIFAVAGDPMIRFRRDRWIYEYGIKHVDRVVVQNEHQARFVQEAFGRDSVLIPNCYQPSVNRHSTVCTNVLWVSTIRKLKRPELFLDLARALPGYRFTMVGGAGANEMSLYRAISARAQTLGNVNFTGFIPYAEADRYFENTDLFVNTSETEGFPNTFLQSWSRGVPTISFIDSGARSGGLPLGRVVASREEMTRTVADLLQDETERTRLGEECKRYVQKNHSVDSILNDYEYIFRRLEFENCQ